MNPIAVLMAMIILVVGAFLALVAIAPDAETECIKQRGEYRADGWVPRRYCHFPERK